MINTIDGFKYHVKIIKAYSDDKGDLYVNGIASGTLEDRDDERMNESVLNDFVDSIKKNAMPLTDAHPTNGPILGQVGEVVDAEVMDDKANEGQKSMFIKAKLDKDHPAVPYMVKQIQKGKKFAFSIEGTQPETRTVWSDKLKKMITEYTKVLPRAISITTEPSYTPSFLSVISKSYNQQLKNNFNLLLNNMTKASQTEPMEVTEEVKPEVKTEAVVEESKPEVTPEVSESDTPAEVKTEETSEEAPEEVTKAKKSEKEDEEDAKDAESKDEEEEDATTNKAAKGDAMPDGSFPIANKKDLKNAIQASGRAKDPEKAKAHIKARAKSLGLEKLIPENWSASKEAEKCATKSVDKAANASDEPEGTENENDEEEEEEDSNTEMMQMMSALAKEVISMKETLAALVESDKEVHSQIGKSFETLTRVTKSINDDVEVLKDTPLQKKSKVLTAKSFDERASEAATPKTFQDVVSSFI